MEYAYVPSSPHVGRSSNVAVQPLAADSVFVPMICFAPPFALRIRFTSTLSARMPSRLPSSFQAFVTVALTFDA